MVNDGDVGGRDRERDHDYVSDEGDDDGDDDGGHERGFHVRGLHERGRDDHDASSVECREHA